MPDDPVISGARDSVTGAPAPILTDAISLRNGAAVATEDQSRAQIIKIGFGEDGEAQDVNGANPLPTADFTPLWTNPTPGGLNVDPTAGSVQLLAAHGRLFAAVNLLDVDVNGDAVPPGAKLWLGYGTAAVAGSGDWIARNGRSPDLYYAGAIYGRLVGHDTPVRVTWVEWPA